MTAAVASALRAHSTRIVLSTDQRDVVDQAERALDAVRPRCVYQRGRLLVHVVRDRSAPGWLARPEGSPVISRLAPERLREELSSAATWIALRKDEEREVMVPPWVPATLKDRGEWSFPPLEGITDAPILRTDGTIHAAPGYDVTTRMIFDPCGATFPALPAKPSHDDATRALAALLEPFADFPFVADSDRAAVAAMILSVIGRSAIDGNVPMFGVGATTPGSGKGLIADGVAVIGTGRAAPKMATTSDDNEMRKRLLAIAIESPAMVVIDNVEGAFGSPVLAMALTTGSVMDRLLGASESRTASLRSVWTYTGNNVQLRGDLGRRVVPIDLDPKVENPEDRCDFKHPDLLAYVRRNRPHLVAAALTVLRAYFVADRPAHGKPPKGSYEAWDRLVRGAIIWSGGADPLAGVQRIRDGADDDRDRLKALLFAWDAKFGTRGAVTIAEALRQAGDSGELHDAFAAYARGGAKVDAKGLGYALRKVRGRIVGGRFIAPDGETHDGAKLWRVQSVAGAPLRPSTAGDAGDAGDEYAEF